MQIAKDNNSVIKTNSILLLFLSVFFHQSKVILGVNISVVDFFCICILTYLIYNNKLIFPLSPTIFFMVVTTSSLIVAVYITPSRFNIDVEITSVIIEFVKIITVFIYFIIGYSLSKLTSTTNIFKWFAIAGLIIGMYGISSTMLDIRLFSNIFYQTELRYNGLMNDPNYFAILQICSLVYFYRVQDVSIFRKVIALLIVTGSVLISGSKTGLITLLLLLSFRISEQIIRSRNKRLIKVSYLILLSISTILLKDYLLSVIVFILEMLSNIIPSVDRMIYIFTDFNSAIQDGGSSRNVTWGTALNLIKISPIFGVGFGSYSKVSTELFGISNIAHNTYLQLSVDWGVPLTLLFLFYLINKLLSKTINTNSVDFTSKMISRDIIIIFLISSMAISLNNARFFWLVLGILIGLLNKENSSS